jgi:hypothetical protein
MLYRNGPAENYCLQGSGEKIGWFGLRAIAIGWPSTSNSPSGVVITSARLGARNLLCPEKRKADPPASLVTTKFQDLTRALT